MNVRIATEDKICNTATHAYTFKGELIRGVMYTGLGEDNVYNQNLGT